MMMGIGFAEMLSVFFLFGGMFGVPLGVPPAKEDPTLAKIAPAECLFYTAWAGLAEPDPKSANHTEQLLAEAEVREFVVDVERRIRSALNANAEREGSPEAKLLAEVLPKWGRAVLTKGTAIYLEEIKLVPVGPEQRMPMVKAGLVMNAGADAAELKGLLEKLEKEAEGLEIKSVTIAGAPFHQFKPDPTAPLVTWGVKGNYIVAGLGEGVVEGILGRMTKEPPKWLTDVRKSLPVERPSTVAYVDVKKMVALFSSMPEFGVPVAPMLEVLGFANVVSYSAVTGLDQSGFVNKTLIRLNGEPQGLLSFAAAKPLAAADLSNIPQDTPVALSLRLSGASLLDSILKSVGKIEPRAVAEFDEGLKQAQKELGVDVRADILASLGDVWQVYAAPDAGGLITGWTATVSIKDRARFAAAHQKLVSKAREEFGDHEFAPQIKQLKFAGQDLYYVIPPPNEGMPFTPAWCIAGDRLVVGLYPQTIKAHLSRAKGAKSLADVPEVAQVLKGPQGPIMVSYLDTKELLRLVYPFVEIGLQYGLTEIRRETNVDIDMSVLPSLAAINKHLRPGVTVMRRSTAGIEFESHQTLPGGNVGATAPVMAALLLPAVQSARGAARRMSSTNNLKQIGLALHNSHDSFASFPAAYSTDKDGQPLLSWRVHILPYIEQAPLYDQFHLNEPWDSEHNKKLIAQMPPVYRSPNSKADPTKTNYVAIRAKSGIIVPPGDGEKGKERPTGLRMADITDGTSNTIMVVEASDEKAVVWTKPDDFEPNEMAPIKGLVGVMPRAFLALFCDGSVRTISESIDDETLKNLFSRNDGKVIGEIPEGPGRGPRKAVPRDLRAVPAPAIERVPPRAIPEPRKAVPEKAPQP